MAVVAVGLIVGGMSLALAPANETFTRLDNQLIPARNEIDSASASYAETARTLQRAAVETDPAARSAAFAQLAASNSAGGAAWKSFKRLSVGLPGEGAMQRVFEDDRTLGLALGVQFLQGPVTSVTEFADVAEVSNAILADLNKVKSLYQAQVERAIRETNQDLTATQRSIWLLAAAVLVVLLISFWLAAARRSRA